MSCVGKIGGVTEIGRSIDVLSLEWRIPNFLSLDSKTGDYYDSPLFNACDGEWVLKIYPSHVALALFRMFAGPPKTFHVTFGIRGSEGVENRSEMLREFSPNDRVLLEICTRSKLEKNMSRLMPGKELIITCDMRSDVPSILRDASSQTEAEFKEASVPAFGKQSSEKQGIEKVAEDMGKLLASGKKTDITMQVKEAEFKVHSNIISARSPVLSAMLEHDTAERATNKICIDDCEPDVFEDYLRYIYTGSVKSLSQQSVFGLYRVADKYLAEDLKLLCLQHIQNTLCVQTFCDTVKLALTHGEKDLLQLAIDFATKNIRFIVISTEWQNFICEYPKEANEIFIKVLGPPS